jgi:phosphatidylinositol 4-kinase type 2
MDYSLRTGLPHSESKVLRTFIHLDAMPEPFFDSYISEAAASLLDTRLNLNIVPKTELVSLSSPVRVSPVRWLQHLCVVLL